MSYLSVRAVQGEKAQKVAALAAGAYAFFAGMLLAQIVCGFVGVGG